MTINDFLDSASDRLSNNNIPTARLDTLILLEDILTKDRAWIIAHPEYQLTSVQQKKLESNINRRAQHEPLAYIRGKSEFYGKQFLVNKHTLEPRPETETLIDLFKGIVTPNDKVQVVDVGTGSGCIAITLSLDLPHLKVLATDIDAECISVALSNQEILKSSVSFYQGNLLESVASQLSEDYIVVANLPYVPSSHTINRAAMFEPAHAIFGGEDGLDLYREMFEQVSSYQLKPSLIFTESLPFQHQSLNKLAVESDFSLVKTEDFIQVFEYKH